jgi:hypothetical protein
MTDKIQGFGVPAKSLFIENRAGGAGINVIYYQTSDDGVNFSNVVSLLPDQFRAYSTSDGMVIISMLVWASNANCRVAIDATPGLWTTEEYRDYVPKSIIQKLNESQDAGEPVWSLAEVEL